MMNVIEIITAEKAEKYIERESSCISFCIKWPIYHQPRIYTSYIWLIALLYHLTNRELPLSEMRGRQFHPQWCPV